MAFEITDLTEARLATVTTRVEKHGDDEKPAVSIGIEIETGNDILDRLDGMLRPTLYKRKDDEPDLPGIETTLPVLRCNAIERVTIPTKHEGWTLNVDTTGDESRMTTFGSCKVDKFSVEPRQGGSVTLRLRIGTSDIDAASSGMLAMHIGQPIWITLVAPQLGSEPIDGTQKAFERDHPADAGELFAAAHAGPDDAADSEGGDTDVEGEIVGDGTGEALPPIDEGQPSVERQAEPWPFPRKPISGEPPAPDPLGTSKRTARGREATAKALAAGAEAAKP